MGVRLTVFSVTWALRTDSTTAVVLSRVRLSSQFRSPRRSRQFRSSDRRGSRQADVWISELTPLGHLGFVAWVGRSSYSLTQA